MSLLLQPNDCFMDDIPPPDSGHTEYNIKAAFDGPELHLADLEVSRPRYIQNFQEYAPSCRPGVHRPRFSACNHEQASRTHNSKFSTAPYHANHTNLRPSYSDWKMLQPMIKALYKVETARMIVAKIQSKGFYVTEKMLRERIRQWGINNKNRRSKAAQFIPNHNQSLVEDQVAVPEPPIITLERPISTNADKIEEFRMLSTIDHFLEDSWSGQAGLFEGYDVVEQLITLENAMMLASEINSAAAWAQLRQADVALKGMSWSRISPRNIIYMIRVMGHWGFECNEFLRSLRTLLRHCISTIIGAQHPVALLMKAVSTKPLDIETYLTIISIATTKAEATNATIYDKRSMHYHSRFSHLELLRYYGQHKRIEDILNSWTPTTAFDDCEKLRYLAQAKYDMSEFNEAEQIYGKALRTFTALYQLVSIITGHVRTLIRLNRPEDAIEMFLEGLSLYEEAAGREYDPTTGALDVEWFRQDAAKLRDQAGSERLESAIAKLEACTIADETAIDDVAKPELDMLFE